MLGRRHGQTQPPPPPPPASQKAGKGRKIALSSFVTKKRASSPLSQSGSSDASSDATSAGESADSACAKPHRLNLPRGKNGRFLPARQRKAVTPVPPGENPPVLESGGKAKNNAGPAQSKLSHHAVPKSQGPPSSLAVKCDEEDETPAQLELPAVSQPSFDDQVLCNGKAAQRDCPRLASLPPPATALSSGKLAQPNRTSGMSSATVVEGPEEEEEEEEEGAVLNGYVSRHGRRSTVDAKSIGTAPLSCTTTGTGRAAMSFCHASLSPTRDDDQTSVSSSTTSNSTCVAVPPTQQRAGASRRGRGGRGGSRREWPNHGSRASVTTGFCFAEFFGQSTPRLVLRGGELQPETSLSLRNVEDYRSLPEDHPIFRWSLGQPVKGSAHGNGGGRRRRRTRRPRGGLGVQPMNRDS